MIGVHQYRPSRDSIDEIAYKAEVGSLVMPIGFRELIINAAK
jgi:hypothetical protein